MSEKRPLVSIITPLYNSRDFFEDTYNSVINQTVKDWEWIIVDDCSTDGSYELAKRLIGDNPKIRLVKADRNQGPAIQRNRGLDIAKGRYIAFLDADDMWDPCFLQSQLDFIKANGPFVCSSYRRISGDKVSDYIVPQKNTYSSILKGNPIAPLTAVFDREYFPDARFDESVYYCEDLVFWLTLLKKCESCNGNPAVIATYRIHPSARSYGKLKLIGKQWYVYRKLRIGFFKSCYCLMHWAVYGLNKYRHLR